MTAATERRPHDLQTDGGRDAFHLHGRCGCLQPECAPGLGHEGHPDLHPTFCANADDPFADCGTHLAAPVTIPATAGPWRVIDGGALYGAVSASAAQTDDRLPAVLVEVSTPTGVLLSPSETRRLIAVLTAAVLDAEAGA